MKWAAQQAQNNYSKRDPKQKHYSQPNLKQEHKANNHYIRMTATDVLTKPRESKIYGAGSLIAHYRDQYKSITTFFSLYLLSFLREAVRCETRAIPVNSTTYSERDKNAASFNEVSHTHARLVNTC